MKPRWFLGMLIGALALAACGCANVRPWERDLLAQYGMQPLRDPLASATREHLWFSREAANGGRSIGGGGCGCN